MKNDKSAEHIGAFLRAVKGRGITDPAKSPEFERAFGITGETVRQIVHELRMQGHPIGSGRQGYFYARNKAEIAETISHIEGRRNSLEAVGGALRRTLAKLPGIGEPVPKQMEIL